MALLTFDHPGPELPDIEDILHDKKADIVECGENNEVWVNAVRSKKEMQLISKVDGSVKKRVPVDDAFARIAASYGIGPRQIGAVRAAVCRE